MVFFINILDQALLQQLISEETERKSIVTSHELVTNSNDDQDLKSLGITGLQNDTEEQTKYKEDNDGKDMFAWPNKAVMRFLEIYSAKEHEFTAGLKRRNKLWSEIALELQKSNYDVSGVQVQNKMSGLKRTYKKIKDSNIKSGKLNRNWPFYLTMDAIFGDESWFSPSNIANSDEQATLSTFLSSSACHSPLSIQNNSEYQESSSNPKKKKVEMTLDFSISQSKNGKNQLKETRNRERLERGKGRQQRSEIKQKGKREMHKESSNEREMFTWPDKAVKLFLEIYREKEHEFTAGIKRHDKLWSEIAFELQEANYNVSGLQVQNKMSSLKRAYKKIKDSNAKSDKQNSSWIFYSIMDSLFGDQRCVSPPYVASSEGPATLRTFLSSSAYESPLLIPNNSEYEESSSRPKKKKIEMILDSSLSHWKTDKNQLKETRNTERLEREKGRQQKSEIKQTEIREMHKEGSNEREMFTWPDKAVQLFLEIYRERDHEFTAGIKRHNKLWSEIAFELQKSNYDVSGMQVQNKMSGLKRTYKKIKDANAKSGNRNSSWAFYSIMDSLFGDKNWVAPPDVAGIDRPSTPSTSSSSSMCHSLLSTQDNSGCQEFSSKSKKKRVEIILDSFISGLKNNRDQMKEERRIERLEREERRQERWEVEQEERRKMHKETSEIQRSLVNVLNKILEKLNEQK